MPDAPLPPPDLRELAPVNPLTAAQGSIATTAGAYASIMLPSDTVLRAKGGSLDIYKEVLRDDQVASTFQQRRLGVVSAPWTVEPGADDAASVAAAEALRANLNRIEFDRATNGMLFSIFYGFAVGEVIWEARDGLIQVGSIKVRDRTRFRFGMGRELYLLKSGLQYEQMPDRKFWTVNTGADHDDEPYGMGLAHWLYWPTYFKRNDIKFWLIFLEKFGMPTASAKLPAGQIEDRAMRRQALEALQAIQTDGGVLIPEGVTIELIEAARSGTADYATMQAAMNAAISKIVLSQTMTTDSGSSRSQAEVHSGVAHSVIKADSDLICQSFNRTIATWFAEYNFPGAQPPIVSRMTDPPEDLAARAERDVKIKSLGFEPTEEYIEDTYGPGWVKSKNANRMLGALLGASNPNAPGMPDAEPGADDQEDFAEVAALAAVRAINRNDQRALVAAANTLAARYEQAIGPQLRQLVSYAEDSGDFESFRERLREMLRQPPEPKAIETLERAGFMARLMGAFRGQR